MAGDRDQHDPGDEDRDEVPVLSVERVRELLDQAVAGARETHAAAQAQRRVVEPERAFRHGGRAR